MTDHRRFKDGLYAQFARIGHAVSTPKRIEILDRLGHADRSVAEVAALIATPIKNTSAHLRALREAGLVETRRDGQRVVYRLADRRVHEFVGQLQGLARARLAEVDKALQQFFGDCDELETISVRELERRMNTGDVTVVDVRPREEYEAGHIPGALWVPLKALKTRRGAPSKSRDVVVYCRGPYCVMAPEAATFLRRRGYRALHFVDGLPGWRLQGKRVVAGV
jgi:rhodanese-related sulfurtransferase/DNA-binding transcriptional ArsR family regulator